MERWQGLIGLFVRVRGAVLALADGLDEAAEVVGMHVADVADAEGVGLRDFTRVDDEASRLELGVEVLEVEACVRVVEGGDDGRLNFVGQQRAEAQRTHSFDQRVVVGAVAAVACLDAPLRPEVPPRLA